MNAQELINQKYTTGKLKVISEGSIVVKSKTNLLTTKEYLLISEFLQSQEVSEKGRCNGNTPNKQYRITENWYALATGWQISLITYSAKQRGKKDFLKIEITKLQLT